jgi:DNA helicase-2/ATP-dependent DNA helicase PcrA
MEDTISFEDRSSDDEFSWWDSDEPPYAVGTRVEHDDYGEGIVLRIGGVGQRQRITVAFDEVGEKQFVLGFAPLRRIR